MKHYLLIAVASLLAGTSLAQTQGPHGELIDDHDIIIEAPYGLDTHVYQREGGYILVADGYLWQYDINSTMNIVECEDGTMFFQNFVSQTDFGTWVVGQRVGNTVVIPMDQKIGYDEEYDSTISLHRFLFTMEGDIYDEESDAIFDVTNEGGNDILTLRPASEDYNFLGAMWDDDSSVYTVGDYATILTYDPNFQDSEFYHPVYMPEDVETFIYETKAYSYTYSEEYRRDTYITFDVEFAYVGNDVYIKGLYYPEPQFVVKGVKEGNVITFPRFQFLGKDGRNVDIFAVAVKYGVDEDGIEVFVDGDNWTLTDNGKDKYIGDADGAVRFARNPYYRYGNSYESIDEIEMTLKGSSAITELETEHNTGKALIDLNGRQFKGDANGRLVIKNKIVL
ncbi:MAG: hypothetical protein KBT20_07850 [Bacteroidales bacterium]|nr:hypothetical protein [Candidatus Liminaster caballi]